MTTIYMVGCVEKQKEITTPYGVKKLDMDWADGMIGVCPVFSTREQAEKYSKNLEIIELEILESEEKKCTQK